MTAPSSNSPKRARRRQLRGAEDIEVLASAVRLDLLAALRSGPPASVAELAQRLQRRPTALYHHIRRLCEAGLVHVAAQRRSGRRDEALYALIAPQITARPGERRVTGQARERSESGAQRPSREAPGRAAMARVGQALMRQMARDYTRALAEPATPFQGAGREAALALLSLRLGPESLAELNRELNALLARWAEVQPQGGGRALRLALVMVPAR